MTATQTTNIQHSTFNIQHSTFNLQPSTFNLQPESKSVSNINGKIYPISIQFLAALFPSDLARVQTEMSAISGNNI